MSAFAQVSVSGVSAAHHNPLDVQTKAHLALSRDKVVRRALAARDTVPLGIQAMLALDGHRGVVEALLENPTTPPGALESLAGHALPTVRMKSAKLL